MFLFSKSFNLNVYKDFYRKINNNNYQKVCNKKGEILNLSFLNVKFKKKPKTKIKHLFILELISLNKSFYTFQLNKTKRKKIFVNSMLITKINKKYLNYFFFIFLKQFLFLTQDLQKFSIQPTFKKIEIESLNAFDLLYKNNSYFNDIKNLNFHFKNKFIIKKSKLFITHLLGFYKISF